MTCRAGHSEGLLPRPASRTSTSTPQGQSRAPPSDGLGYGVDHRDALFAFHTGNRQPVLYPGGTRPSDLAADLPLLAQGDPS